MKNWDQKLQTDPFLVVKVSVRSSSNFHEINPSSVPAVNVPDAASSADILSASKATSKTPWRAKVNSARWCASSAQTTSNQLGRSSRILTPPPSPYKYPPLKWWLYLIRLDQKRTQFTCLDPAATKRILSRQNREEYLNYTHLFHRETWTFTSNHIMDSLNQTQFEVFGTPLGYASCT